jgi:ribosomal protein L21E
MKYFLENEKVRILINPRNQKSRLHIKYHNVIGTILNQQGKAYKVSVCFNRRVFLPIITIDNLHKVVN